ncbi:MAG: DUF6468 domain-containing protein [Rhodospirillaceae bacterium]|nr:DUF6468 domain-containing protein [Rhodospirillaceae bacterium]
MTISLVLDVTIAVLLMLTIAYAIRLNARLSQLRGDKAELEALAKTFTSATHRAEEGTKVLKISTDLLTAEIKKAEVLKDDLAYLVERGGTTADEMMERVRASHKFSAPVNKGSFSDEDLAGDVVDEFSLNKIDDFGDNPLRDSIKNSRKKIAPANLVKNSLRAREGGENIDPQADAERVLMKVLGAAR